MPTRVFYRVWASSCFVHLKFSLCASMRVERVLPHLAANVELSRRAALTAEANWVWEYELHRDLACSKGLALPSCVEYSRLAQFAAEAG